MNGLKNTFCKQIKDFKAFECLFMLIFLSFICKLTEISINLSISLGAEKRRKRGIKNVDLTKYYAILTDSRNLPATLFEMMLMILGNHCRVFGK
jgi:hypothetical protein